MDTQLSTAASVDEVSDKVPTLAIAALCVTEFFTLGAVIGPAFGGIAIRAGVLTEFGQRWENAQSLVLWTGALAALASNVFFGAVTDALARRGKHRAWWLPVGVTVGLPFLFLCAYGHSLATLVIGWIGVQLAYNATFAPLYGLVSDLTKPGERARVGGWFAGSATASLVLGAAVIAWFVPKGPPFSIDAVAHLFVYVGIVAIPVTMVAALYLHGLPVRSMPPIDSGERAGAPFWWLAAQRTLAQGAFGFATAFGSIALVRRVGIDPGTAAARFALYFAIAAVLCTVISVVVARPLALRVGPRAVMAGGCLFLIASCVTLMFATSVAAFGVGLILAGAGTGAFFATDLAAALAVVPDGARGRYLGLFNMARTLPQALVPVAAPSLLAWGADRYGVVHQKNYFAFFGVGAVVALLALALVVPLTLPDRDGEAHRQ